MSCLRAIFLNRVTLSAVVIFSFCAAAASAYLALPHTPEAFFAVEPVIDLGELEQGQTVEGTFTLVNGLREAVSIRGFTESCSCTVPVPKQIHYAPRDEEQVVVRWKTGAARGDVSVAVWMDYATASGERGALTLELKAHILPDVEYYPGTKDSHVSPTRARGSVPGKARAGTSG